jgi:MYXO-CTERM domain-containing protein
VQVWHGSADTTVAPLNQTELVKQWTDVHGVDADPDASEALGKVTRSEFRDGSRVIVELNSIAGMGHAVPIGGDGCVSTSHAFFSDQGICSTLRAAQFFGIVGGESGDGNGSGDGSGSGSGGSSDDEPSSGSCSLAGGGSAPFAVAVLAVVVRRRRRR